jgi:DcuC family C4-dicarboxylate transporter
MTRNTNLFGFLLGMFNKKHSHLVDKLSSKSLDWVFSFLSPKFTYLKTGKEHAMEPDSSMQLNKGTYYPAQKEKSQGILISLLAFSYILLQFFPIQLVKFLVSLLILAIILWVMPRIRGSTLVVSSTLLCIALGLMIYHGASFQEWLEAMRVNVTLVALFLFVPLLGIPVRTGGYVEALKLVLSRRMNNPYFFFFGSKFLTHVLGVVLNIGSVSIVYQLTQASNIKTPRLIASAINRGFVSTIFWSPYFSAMALVLSQLPIKWSSIVLYLIGLALISMFVSFCIERSLVRRNLPIEPRESMIIVKEETIIEGKINEKKDLTVAKRKVVELFILLVLMMGVVLLVEAFSSYPMVLIICLVSVIFPLLWCICSGEGAPYIEEFKKHVFVGIPMMKKEIVLFLVAGLFSGAIVYAELSGYLIDLIHSVFGSFTLGTAFFLSSLIIISGLIGLHPIVVVTILVTSVKPELIGFSPEYFAVLLLTSWGISNTISPATAVNNLLANLLKVDIFELSIRWNMMYVLIMLILIPLYLKLVGL